MAAIPDSFDLQVRRAREATPERQLDFLLGTLLALPEWWLLNRGSESEPYPAMVELEKAKCVVVFSAPGKLQDFAEELNGGKRESVPNVAIRVPEVVDYCLLFRAVGATAILVNPGDFAFTVEFDALESFTKAWRERRATVGDSRGFWIPNMTSEEEDFWQSHGL